MNLLVVYQINAHINQLQQYGTTTRAGILQLRRDDAVRRPIMSMRVLLVIDDYTDHTQTITSIDHPNTTSAVEYSLWSNNHSDASVFYWQHDFVGVTHNLRGFAIELNSTTGEY